MYYVCTMYIVHVCIYIYICMYNVYIVHMPCFCNPTLRQGKTRAVPVGCWREHPSRGQEETALSGSLRGLSAQLVG